MHSSGARRARQTPALARRLRAGHAAVMGHDLAPPPDWDDRYAAPGWAFGDQPNDFLREEAHRLPARGRVLCLAEGQGRNAVYLATLGHDVTAMDQSAVGMGRAAELAAAHGVTIHTEVGDLTDFVIEPAAWDAIVSIYAHTSGEV